MLNQMTLFSSTVCDQVLMTMSHIDSPSSFWTCHPDRGSRRRRGRWTRRVFVLMLPWWVAFDGFLGICAMDYLGDDPYPNAETPGIIVDDVSRFEQLHICNQSLAS